MHSCASDGHETADCRCSMTIPCTVRSWGVLSCTVRNGNVMPCTAEHDAAGMLQLPHFIVTVLPLLMELRNH